MSAIKFIILISMAATSLSHAETPLSHPLKFKMDFSYVTDRHRLQFHNEQVVGFENHNWHALGDAQEGVGGVLEQNTGNNKFSIKIHAENN